jgi:peptidyl-prolyl cis-trans isomerase C
MTITSRIRQTIETVRDSCPRRARVVAVAALGTGLALATGALAQDEEVLARVNGTEITVADVAAATEIYADQLGAMPEDARRSVLVDALIELRIVADAAKAANIDAGEAYKHQMAFLEAQTLRFVFMSREVASAVTEDKVRKAYDEQVARLPDVEEMRLRHILAATEQEAVEVIDVLNSGKDFAEVAQARSMDSASKAKGGDLGFMATGQSIAEVDAAAARFQPGEFTSAPVKSPFGYHIVKLEERRQRPAPAYEAVSPQIRATLGAAEARRIVAELRAKAKIEKLILDLSPPASNDDYED